MLMMMCIFGEKWDSYTWVVFESQRGMGMKINDKFQSITVVINDNYNSVYEDSSLILETFMKAELWKQLCSRWKMTNVMGYCRKWSANKEKIIENFKYIFLKQILCKIRKTLWLASRDFVISFIKKAFVILMSFLFKNDSKIVSSIPLVIKSHPNSHNEKQLIIIKVTITDYF